MFLQSLEAKQPREVFYKKAIIRNFAIFTGKNLCWSLFIIIIQSFRPATLLKRDSAPVVSCEYFISKKIFEWLLLGLLDLQPMNCCASVFLRIWLSQNNYFLTKRTAILNIEAIFFTRIFHGFR